MKLCIACGMPMRQPADFALGDTAKNYCVHCMSADGSMQSYAEKLQGTVEFIIKSQGLDRVAAENAAKDMLKRLPAWKGEEP